MPTGPRTENVPGNERNICQPGEAPVEVERHLRGASFPATRDELVTFAKENDAPEAVVVAIESLPQEWFDSIDDACSAWEAVPRQYR